MQLRNLYGAQPPGPPTHAAVACVGVEVPSAAWKALKARIKGSGHISTYLNEPLCFYYLQILPRSRGRLRSINILLIFISIWLFGCHMQQPDIVIGSKNFTEQTVLGEILAQHIENKTGLKVERHFYLAGTYICQQSLLAGRIDMYVEYTGTALTAVLKEKPSGFSQEVFQRVKDDYQHRFNLEVEPPLGFNNSFALVIRGEDAQRLHLRTLSDAEKYAPNWRLGVGYEFLERPDGFAGLAKAYNFHFAEPPRVMDLGLLYRALTTKQVDMIVGSATDGLIQAHGLVVLEDDKHYFPPYDAVPVVREQTLKRYPQVRDALADLAGKITAEDMQRLNYAVDGEHRDAANVAAEFLRSKRL